jgi:hypothetical protein
MTMSRDALEKLEPGSALERDRVFRLTWGVALGLFVVANLTGVLFRWAIAIGLESAELGGLQLGNIRHAHSHLMFFGWATPALMSLLALTVERRTGRSMRGIGPVLVLVLILAMMAYPPFLLWGYTPATLGDARLPLSVMAAGFNVLGWYAFAAIYVRATLGVERDAILRIFDLAVLLLVFSTVGAWGLPIAQAFGVDSAALTAVLTHLFLDTFSEGWFVLGVLGLAYASAAEAGRPPVLWPVLVAGVGIPFAFASALPAGFVTPLWQGLGSFSGATVALGLLGATAVLWRQRGACRLALLWRVALALLVLKAVGQFAVAVAPGAGWAELHGLRILYLHLMLLGFATLGLFAAAEAEFRAIGHAGLLAMAVAVAVLITTLVPLTHLWPDTLIGTWTLYAAAIGTLPTVFVGICVLGRVLFWPPAQQRERAS